MQTLYFVTHIFRPRPSLYELDLLESSTIPVLNIFGYDSDNKSSSQYHLYLKTIYNIISLNT